MIEGRAEPRRRDRVGLLQVIECGVGKDHPPAKSIVGPIAFDNGYLAARIMQFHQQAKIQSCRAAAYAYDVHVVSGYSTFPAMRLINRGPTRIRSDERRVGKEGGSKCCCRGSP